MSISQKASFAENSCFGLHPVPEARLTSDTAAVSTILPLLESQSMPDRQSAKTDDFQRLVRIFSATSSQTDPSWFTFSEMLGHPAPELSRRLMQRLSNFSHAIKQQDERRFRELADGFDNDRGFEILDSFLDVAMRGQEPVVEDNMAFITSVPGAFSVRIGACEGSVRNLLAETVRERGFNQQGIALLGSWLIHDVKEVQDAISYAFKAEAMPGGQYFVREENAKSTLEALLKHTNNFVLSPWHIDDAPASAFSM
jgi:hypothetical protein